MNRANERGEMDKPVGVLSVMDRAFAATVPMDIEMALWDLREARAAVAELIDCAQELRDLMQGVIDGDYTPDSFTLQPICAALAKATGADA